MERMHIAPEVVEISTLKVQTLNWQTKTFQLTSLEYSITPLIQSQTKSPLTLLKGFSMYTQTYVIPMYCATYLIRHCYNYACAQSNGNCKLTVQMFIYKYNLTMIFPGSLLDKQCLAFFKTFFHIERTSKSISH